MHRPMLSADRGASCGAPRDGGATTRTGGAVRRARIHAGCASGAVHTAKCRRDKAGAWPSNAFSSATQRFGTLDQRAFDQHVERAGAAIGVLRARDVRDACDRVVARIDDGVDEAGFARAWRNYGACGAARAADTILRESGTGARHAAYGRAKRGSTAPRSESKPRAHRRPATATRGMTD